jgi:hypothetical protein
MVREADVRYAVRVGLAPAGVVLEADVRLAIKFGLTAYTIGAIAARSSSHSLDHESHTDRAQYDISVTESSKLHVFQIDS